MNNEGSKAVSRAMTATTIFSILCILFSFVALMEMGEGTAVAFLGIGIMGFVFRAILKGFRSIVEASELYKERNGIQE